MYRTPIRFTLALLFCGLIGCVNEAASQASPVRAQSTSNSNSSAQASLTSPSGKAVVDGDTVEIRGGELSVNGVSYGAVPPGVRVRYVKGNGAARVLVGDEARQPSPAK